MAKGMFGNVNHFLLRHTT